MNGTGSTLELAPLKILFASFRALLPNLLIDVGGATALYYVLSPHFAKTSVMPVLGASLVPLVSVAFNVVRNRKIDVVGLIVLLGLLGSIPAALFGGGQRWLLVRESFFTGFAGVALFVSPMFRNPIGYYVVSHFMSAHQPQESTLLDTLWESPIFRKTIRFITYFWGIILLTEFGLRVFMALTLPVVFVLAVGPLILNAMMLAAGALSAVTFSRAMRAALS
jgi:hypothetical protein